MDLRLARPALAGSPLPYALRRQAARQVLDEYRAALRAGALSAVPGLDELEQSVLRRGAELAHLLLTGSEWEVAQGLTALELEKWKGGQLLDLMAAAEPVVAAELVRNRRAVSVLRALKTCRDNGVYNVGTGHTLGWLCGELFR